MPERSGLRRRRLHCRSRSSYPRLMALPASGGSAAAWKPATNEPTTTWTGRPRPYALNAAITAPALACTVAEEMLQLSRATDVLREAGLASWIPSPEAIDACLDKWRFVQVMHGAGIPVPDTAVSSSCPRWLATLWKHSIS